MRNGGTDIISSHAPVVPHTKIEYTREGLFELDFSQMLSTHQCLTSVAVGNENMCENYTYHRNWVGKETFVFSDSSDR